MDFIQKAKKQKSLLFLLITLALLLGAGILYLLLGGFGKAEAPSLLITPQSQDALGIPTNTGFDLQASVPLKQEELSELLSVEPSVELALVGGEKNWIATPLTPLLENTVYTFKVKNPSAQSFAFQTRGDLAVSAIYPADTSSYVALESSIELTLNAPDMDVKSAFHILPETKGVLTTKGYITTFVPTEPLLPDAIYRITLTKGLSAPNGMALQENFTASFETSPERNGAAHPSPPLHLVGQYAETFLPGDLLAVELQGDESVNEVSFDIDLRRYPDVAAYEAELRAHDAYYQNRYGMKKEYQADYTKLEQVANFKATLFQKENNDWASRYAVLPENLPEGWYLATLSGTDKMGRELLVQKQIQLCSQAVYLQSLNGNTLLWLNNPVDAKPLSSAQVVLEDTLDKKQSFEALTDKEGIAKLATKDLSGAYLKILTNGTTRYFEPVSLAATQEQSRKEQFYTAIYTDREIYQPSDTIRFWGSLSPRSSAYPLPSSVTVKLSPGWDGESTAYSQKVAVKTDGSFTGELQITGLKKDYYHFNVTDGSNRKPKVALYNYYGDVDPTSYSSKSFSIEEYTKPPYVVNITHNKPYYFEDEPIDFQVNATYFDGAPLANGKLQLSAYNLKETADSPALLALDTQGNASFIGTHTQRKTDENNNNQPEYPSWNASNIWGSITSADSEDVYQETSIDLPVFPSRVASKITSDSPSSLMIKTSAFDTAKLDRFYTESPTNAYPEYEDLAGAPLDIPLTLIVTCNETVQTKAGSYYDPINKKTIQKYTYDYKSSVVDKIETKTTNGTLTLDITPYQRTPLKSYAFQIEFDGKVCGTVRDFFYPYSFYNYGENLTNYSFEQTTLQNNENQYKLGEKISLGLYANGEKIPNKGRVLYSVLGQSNLETGIFTEAEKSLSFTEALIPNIRVEGAYFDGRHVYQIDPLLANYDYSERELKVEVSSDKASYAPGETAKLSVKLSTPDGKPAAGTACVGVVDEAVFTLAPQDLDIMEQLYRQFTPQVARSASYKEYDLSRPNPETGGMGGGGPMGTPLRQNFVDTALFAPLTVDETGSATVELRFPDNTTSWRMTAAAVTPELFGGSSVGNTIVTLPFQVRAVFTDAYLEGDELSISLNSVTSGKQNAPAPGAATEYTAELCSSDGKVLASKTISGKLGESIPFSFGKQAVGQYKLRVSGKSGSFSDAIEQPVSFTKEAAILPLLQTGSLEEISKLTSLRYPVEVTVYDQSLSTYLRALQTIFAQSGERTELLAASYQASALFNRLLDPALQAPPRKDARLETIQTEEGGVKFLPLSQPSAETTAKLLLSAPELIGKEAAVTFLRKELTRKEANLQDRVMAYAGLAAAKEPVLGTVRQILSGEISLGDPLSTVQKLTLAAGLAKAGDQESAKAVYDSFLPARKTTKEGLIYLDMAGEMKAAENQNVDSKTWEASTAALLVTALSGHEDAEGLAKWILANYPSAESGRSDMASLELLSYASKVESAKEAQGRKAKFSVTRNGKKQTIELDGDGIYSLSLNAEDFAAGLKSVSGDLAATARTSAYGKASASTESKVKIEKKIVPLASATDLTLLGRARVELKVTFLDGAAAGCYQISDLLPSGMRILNCTDYRLNPNSAQLWSYSQTEGQRVDCVLYFDPDAKDDEHPIPLQNPEGLAPSGAVGPREYIFCYYANCTLPGQFTNPSAFITSPNAAVTATPSGKITIQNEV